MRDRRRKSIGAVLSALFAALIVLAATGGSGLAAGSPASGTHVLAGPLAKTSAQHPIVGHSYKNMLTRSLRSMHLPGFNPTGHREAAENPLLTKGRKLQNRPDTVVQRTMPRRNIPSPNFTFDGIPFPGVNCNCAPPDTNGEVGLTQYVQIVNEGFQVFDKSNGNSIFGPVAISSLWQGFGGLCENNGFGDPVVLYDQLANRWVITEFAGNYPATPITDECIAVSTSSDASGTYNVYGFHLGEDFFDYPKLGVWPDAYYMGMNVFNASGTAFLGPQPFAFDRTAMLAGDPATFITFRDPSFFQPTSDQFMPADLDGLNPPPAGAPNPFMSTGTNPTWPLYHFHVDFANPANATFTLDATLTPAPFSVICGGGSCVPQLGTADTLDTLGDRGMFRSAYRNFGDHEALVGNMTVASGGVAGVRWFELNNVTSGTPSFVQQSTYQPDNTWRWMGSLAMDHSGDMALGYSASDATINPQIRYTGRLASDPPNTMGQGEAHLFDGTGSQTDTVSRWGDYSDMTVDPVDDCTFWYTQEYYQTTSSFNWRTRIGNFRFPTCTTQLTGTLEGTVTDSVTSNPIGGATIHVAPLGATTTTDASGHYQILLPVGDYQVTASAFGYDTSDPRPATITDGGTTTVDFALNPSPSGSLSGTVTDSANNPIENATVTILGTPIPPTTTDASGHYSFASVPNGTYNVKAEAGRCNTSQTDSVTVNGDTTHDFTLPSRHDNFGYMCRLETPDYLQGDTSFPLAGDDNSAPVTLPFSFPFYGQGYTSGNVCTNGFITFGNATCPFSNSGIPSAGTPNAAIYPYWDDMYIDGSSSMWTRTLTSPNRFVIEWRNAAYFPGGTVDRLDFEVVLYENGQILTQYRGVDNAHEQGNSATIGIENADGSDAFQYSFNEASLNTGETAIRYFLPPSGFVQGHVTDFNDNGAIANASVKAIQNGNVIRQTSTDATGFYRMQLPVGSYTVEASKTNYETGSADVEITEDGTTTQDFSLRTARGEVSPTSLQFIVPADQTRTKTLTLSNTGSLPMTWDVGESGGGSSAPAKATRSAGIQRLLHSQGAKLVRTHLSGDQLASPGWVGSRGKGQTARVPAGAPLDPTWSTIAPYPTNIMDNSADIIDGKVYSVGGIDSSFTLQNRGWVYDPDANSWSPIANMPVAREKPGVAAVNGLLYVTGGWDAVGNPIAETDVYDPNTNTWSTVAPNPSPTAAPGVAVNDGQLYFVGGCADGACTPSSHVSRYDPSSDTWDSAASYPTPDSWEGCAGIAGQVYCAGGVSGSVTLTHGWSYDPGSDTWSPIADMPFDLWGSAAGGPNGMLVLAGGVTNGFNTVTNQTVGYDPGTDSWTNLPNASFARYRAGGSCGFYKIGGSSAGFSPSPDSERLSELETCGGPTDVPWLSEDPTSGEIPVGGHQDVAVTVDTHGLAPGVYNARLTFHTNSGRRPNLSVPVQLIVPAYEQGFNSGGLAYTDHSGDTWSADRAYTPANGSGYVQSPPQTASTRSAIGGTDDDPLYQMARITSMTYRFTGLPAGAYLVELKFAEIQNKRAGQRQFDVIVNGSPFLTAFDISAQVGKNFALDRSLYVNVPASGEVSVQLATRRSTGVPILNAIRVTNRPDH